MTGHLHVRLQGTVSVPLPQREAFELFTPTGERRWVPGWDPSFPAAVSDETNPGTVFQTNTQHPVTWIVVDCDRPSSISYCNVSQGQRASVIRVCCEPDTDGATTAHVIYDVTALSHQGDASLHEFAARYEQYMNDWQEAIAAHIAASVELGSVCVTSKDE